VVKPDQLIKRRGKLGLIAVGVDFPTAKQWVLERMNKDQKVRFWLGDIGPLVVLSAMVDWLNP